MKILIKSILIIILALIIVIAPMQTIYSGTISRISPEDYKANELKKEDIGPFEALAGRIAGLVQIVGTIVSVGVLMLIGIRYVISSAEEKAEYKERLLPYFIGAVILFASANLVNIIYTMFKS